MDILHAMATATASNTATSATPKKESAPVKKSPSKAAAVMAAPDKTTTKSSAAETSQPRKRSGDERMVREYLAALVRPKRRGRPVDKASLQARAAAETDPVARVMLLQRALEAGSTEERSLEDLQADFVKIAAAWSEKRGVSWKAWREFGVPPSVLREAGLRETR